MTSQLSSTDMLVHLSGHRSLPAGGWETAVPLAGVLWQDVNCSLPGPRMAAVTIPSLKLRPGTKKAAILGPARCVARLGISPPVKKPWSNDK